MSATGSKKRKNRPETSGEDDGEAAVPEPQAKRQKRTHPPIELKEVVEQTREERLAAAVKAVGQGTALPALPGREAEEKAISAFLDNCFNTGQGDSMYLSGNPGTGKTALLSLILSKVTAKRSPRRALGPIVFLNCMTQVKTLSIAQICTLLIQSLSGKASGRWSKSAADDDDTNDAVGRFLPSGKSTPIDALKEFILGRTGFVVLVLDEIDQLVLAAGPKKQLVYSLYEWAKASGSGLVLFGIANTLDLPDRLLPQLQAKKVAPKSIQFGSYTAEALVGIVTDRLRGVSGGGATEFFDPNALQILARKVADNGGGDCRKVLDVAEQLLSKLAAILREGKVEGDVKVAMKDVLGATESNFAPAPVAEGSALSKQLNGLPVQQQLAALAAFLCCRPAKPGGEGKEVKATVVVEKFKQILAQTRLKVPPVEDLISCLDMLASVNVLKVTAKGGTKAGVKAMLLRRISLLPRPNDFVEVFQNHVIAKTWI